MNNEAYGIEFKAVTDKFKARMKELANDVRNFGKEAKKEATITPEIITSGYQRQINYVKSQMQEISDMLKKTSEGEEIGKDVLKLEADYEKLSNNLDDLNQKQEEYNKNLNETEEISKHSTLGEMFDKSIAKIKRFTFYLLGARSVFSLFMKYQSIYYQYNEKMQYQSELSQNAIALSLAPAFEMLGNVIAYASIAFAKFIELLTGVNVLSKVSTKGIRDYNKSLRESQTLLSGIDEITNLSLPSSTGLASQYQALDEFQKKVKEVEEFFNKNTWLTKLAEGLKTLWEWTQKAFGFIVDNWDKLKYLFLGIGVSSLMFKIGMSLTGVATTLGTTTMAGAVTGTGLLGVAGVLKYLGTIGAISVGVGIIVSGAVQIKEALDEMAKLRKETHEMTLGNLQKWPEVLDVVIERLKHTKQGTEEWKKQTQNVKEAVKGVVSSIVNGKLSYEEYKPIIDEIRKKLQNLNDDEFKAEIDLLMDTTSAEKDYASFIAYLNRVNGTNISVSSPKNPNASSNVLNSSSKTTKAYKSSSSSSSSSFGQKVLDYTGSSIIKTGTNIVNSIKNLFGFSNGLDYVPYDEFPALLHKGEAVVPAKYNPTIHSAGNEQTNALLETLVIKIDDLAKRPNVFEIDGQQFANATYSLYEEAGNNQNYVKGVVR